MTDTRSKRQQTILLVVLVCSVAGVFATQFGGPQAQGCSAGGASVAISVDGRSATEGDFRAAYALRGFDREETARQQSQDLRRLVAYGVVERMLLANAAEELGIVVTPDEAMQEVLLANQIWLSLASDATGFLQSGPVQAPFRDEEGNLDEDMVRRVLASLQRSAGEFSDWQAEEIMAERMRDVIRATVEVPPSEVWDAFVREREKARIKYVRYTASYYRDELTVTDAELTAWMAQHQSEIDQDYSANRYRYTGLPEQVKARHILVQVAGGADEAAKAAARTEAEGLLARIRSGEDFAAVARASSDDASSARKGGDLGWVGRDVIPTAAADAVLALQNGQVSNVIETPGGFEIFEVEGHRQGDVPEADAKREIAERMYRDQKASEAARAAATAALGQLRSGTTMDQLEQSLHPAAPEGQAAPAASSRAPHVEETGEFGPTDNPIQGGGDSLAVATAAFALSTENPVPGAPVQVGQDWVVFRLESRTRATRDAFDDETQQRIGSGLRRAKEREAVRAYVVALRERAEREGRIRVEPSILRYGNEPTEGEGEGEREEGATTEMGAASSMRRDDGE